MPEVSQPTVHGAIYEGTMRLTDRATPAELINVNEAREREARRLRDLKEADPTRPKPSGIRSVWVAEPPAHQHIGPGSSSDSSAPSPKTTRDLRMDEEKQKQKRPSFFRRRRSTYKYAPKKDRFGAFYLGAQTRKKKKRSRHLKKRRSRSKSRCRRRRRRTSHRRASSGRSRKGKKSRRRSTRRRRKSCKCN